MSGSPSGAGRRQVGGFAIGLVVGLLVGLALALGVALYITKAPVPFVNKVPPRTAEQDHAENERNRNWDPNAPLGGKAAARAGSSEVRTVESAPSLPADPPPPAEPPPAEPPPGIAVAPLPSRDAAAAAARMQPPPLVRNAPDAAPARDPAAILDGAPTTAAAPPPPRSTAAAFDPFVYFVQAGAFQRDGDAEQQRARLALMGLTARVTEREQAGRNIYRVRMGPYPSRDEAAQLLQRLQDQGIEAQIVRVERS